MAWCTGHSGTTSMTVSQILMILLALLTFDNVRVNYGKWPDVGQYSYNSIQLLAKYYPAPRLIYPALWLIYIISTLMADALGKALEQLQLDWVPEEAEAKNMENMEEEEEED